MHKAIVYIPISYVCSYEHLLVSTVNANAIISHYKPYTIAIAIVVA